MSVYIYIYTYCTETYYSWKPLNHPDPCREGVSLPNPLPLFFDNKATIWDISSPRSTLLLPADLMTAWVLVRKNTAGRRQSQVKNKQHISYTPETNMALENYHLQEETRLQIGAVSITIFDYLCLVTSQFRSWHSLLSQVNIWFHDLKGPEISRRSINSF